MRGWIEERFILYEEIQKYSSGWYTLSDHLLVTDDDYTDHWILSVLENEVEVRIPAIEPEIINSEKFSAADPDLLTKVEQAIKVSLQDLQCTQAIILPPRQSW